MRHPTMNSPKVLNTDSLLQDMNSLQIRTNAVISASVPNLPKLVQRICHLCLEEYETLKDLQNHISTTHNLSHPTTYYSTSTSGYSTSWKFENLLNIPKASPKQPVEYIVTEGNFENDEFPTMSKSWYTASIWKFYWFLYFTLFYWLLISGIRWNKSVLNPKWGSHFYCKDFDHRCKW